MKEIYKKPNKLNIDDCLNKINQETINKKMITEEKEVVCGSRVCTIF